MLNEFKGLEIKHQLIVCLQFFVGYFSPIIGIILYIYNRYKKKSKLFQYSSLLGIVIALMFYIVQFIVYVL